MATVEPAPNTVRRPHQVSVWITDELSKALKAEKLLREKTLQQIMTEALECYCGMREFESRRVAMDLLDKAHKENARQHAG